LDRGRAKRVAGGEDDGAAFRAQAMAELADRRRLAGAVDADDENHERLLRRVDRERHLDGTQQLEQRAAQRVGGRLERAALDLTEAVDQPRGDLDADIGRQQALLEFLERLVVDAAAEQPAGQPRPALRSEERRVGKAWRSGGACEQTASKTT